MTVDNVKVYCRWARVNSLAFARAAHVCPGAFFGIVHK
jgi:hypothetical protein